MGYHLRTATGCRDCYRAQCCRPWYTCCYGGGSLRGVVIAHVLCVLSVLSGCVFVFLCLLGMFSHNPVLRYAKEITVGRFDLKSATIIRSGDGRIDEGDVAEGTTLSPTVPAVVVAQK